MKNTDLIKDKLNILDVVSSYVKLEAAGKTYKGISPFTNEKTPSFFVSPEKGFFYCFSSGKGGDMFTFIQEIERIEFKEALKILAEKAGVSLAHENSWENTEETTHSFKILDDITRHYEVQLRKNKEVVDYLLQRGLTKETIVAFRLGYARDTWRDSYEYLRSRGYTDEEIERVGLITKKEGSGYYDRFRSRIMFPLMDGRGRVVGFSGRLFEMSGQKVEGAKYLNSPEGPLFDKSKVLYGYHTAKSEMSRKKLCLIVEGQFDVLMCQQAGYLNTVAISGTGLTSQHITMIKRFTDTILLALDSDEAGIKATRRSILLAYKYGLHVKIVVLPSGMDPADLILKSQAQFDTCVLDAKEYVDYRLETFLRNERSFDEKKQLVNTDIFDFIYLTPSAIDQDKMLQKTALFLGVSIEAVRKDFESYAPDPDIHAVVSTAQPAPEGSGSPTPPISHSVEHESTYLYHYMKEQGYLNKGPMLDTAHQLFTTLFGKTLEQAIIDLDETEKHMNLFILQERHATTQESFFLPALLTMLREEQIRRIDAKSSELLTRIRSAELSGNETLLDTLSRELQSTLLSKNDITKDIQK